MLRFFIIFAYLVLLNMPRFNYNFPSCLKEPANSSILAKKCEHLLVQGKNKMNYWF